MKSVCFLMHCKATDTMRRTKPIICAALMLVMVICIALSARADAEYQTCSGRIGEIQFACYEASSSTCVQLEAYSFTMVCRGTKIVILHNMR